VDVSDHLNLFTAFARPGGFLCVGTLSILGRFLDVSGAADGFGIRGRALGRLCAVTGLLIGLWLLCLAHAEEARVAATSQRPGTASFRAGRRNPAQAWWSSCAWAALWQSARWKPIRLRLWRVRPRLGLRPSSRRLSRAQRRDLWGNTGQFRSSAAFPKSWPLQPRYRTQAEHSRRLVVRFPLDPRLLR
jgi:hypothetical protein